MENESTNPISLPTALVNIMIEWDTREHDFVIAEPSFLLESKLKSCKGVSESEQKALFAEVAALQMSLLEGQQRTHWKTRYRPYSEVVLADGTRHCFPNISQIDREVIDYLSSRAHEAKHPVFKARYSDFVWDVAKVATGNNPPIELARDAIDSYVACGISYPDSTYTDERLTRALELALSIRDEGRRNSVIGTMIGLLNTSRFPGSHADWLFNVLLNQNRNILSQGQQDAVTDALEAELKRLTESEKPLGFLTKEPALRLADFYEKSNQPDDVRRVIRAYGTAIERTAEEFDGLHAMPWLQQAYAIFVKFGMKDEAESLQISGKKKGQEAEAQMIPQQFGVEIPGQVMHQLMEELTAGDLKTTLHRIAVNFCPRIQDLTKQLESIRDEGSKTNMFSKSTIANQQIISRVGSLEVDPDGNLLVAMKNNIEWMANLLRHSIDCTRSKHEVTTNSLSDLCRDCPWFDESRTSLIERGFEAYLTDDHVAAVHILIPQIECALRGILSFLGKATNKHRRSDTGVMLEKSLNDILENEAVLEDFLGKDFTLYLRVLLCDPHGLNVRNSVAHGLVGSQYFQRKISDRIMHVFWYLVHVIPPLPVEPEVTNV